MVSTRQYFNHVLDLYVPVAIAVFAIVAGVLAFALVRYRAGRGHEASKTSKHNLLEPMYALFLVGVASFLAVYVANANAAERRSLGAPKLTVTITGYQWCWDFHYEGTPVTVHSTCVNSIPDLVIPTGEIIRFRLTSADVVHEWWLPHARWKEQAFPGHYNDFELRFSKPGHWEGRCDEFCGLNHDLMTFFVTAESPARFKAWLAGQSHLADHAPVPPA